MSHPNIQHIIQSERAQAEYERMSAILDDRTKALHHSEQRISQYQINEKHARSNMRIVMALAVIIFFIMGFGGNV